MQRMLPAIDRGSLPQSILDHDPYASFFFKQVHRFFPDAPESLISGVSLRIVPIRKTQGMMPRLELVVQVFNAPAELLISSSDPDREWEELDDVEDLKPDLHLEFVAWLNSHLGLNIEVIDADTGRGGRLTKDRAATVCAESLLPASTVHEFEAHIYMHEFSFRGISNHGALSLPEAPEVEYLNPNLLT